LSIADLRLGAGVRLKEQNCLNRKSETLNLQFLITGFPLTSAASRLATDTQGPTAQLQKLAAERGINTNQPVLQAAILYP
jgi:hypothetical protein